MRKLMPEGLAGRFVLLLVTALLVANMIAVFFLVSESRRFNREAQDARQVERVITLVSVLETVDPVLWPSIIAESENRMMQTRIENSPLVLAAGPEQRVLFALAVLKQALPNRQIYSTIMSRQDLRLGFNQRNDDRRDALPLEARALGISVELKNQSGGQFWLNSVSAAPGRNAGAALRVLLTGLGLSLVTVLGFGLIFVRQLVGPISELARAAAAAANGDRSARVAISGVREFRLAGAAFNDMQSKIAQFDAERMRTLAAVGHDLRTPITSLRIRAEMLDDDGTREAFIRTLDDMTIMADGLVQFAKSGRESEAKQHVDLVNLLTHLSEARGAVLTVKTSATVLAGPVSLARAIGNLIDNGVRYGGTATVILSQNAGQACITIEDDGPGIAPDQMEALFEPFVRGDASRNNETGGAGLGLSIARAIIVSHGGTLTLENKHPNGLRAIVSLPV